MDELLCERCGGPLTSSVEFGRSCLQCLLSLAMPEEELEAAPVSLPHGTGVGRYRILRLIGEGGMGAVYEAEQEHPRRRVALKIIKPGLASLELLRRFEHESVALGRLQHPGIAQIFEAGTADTGYGPQPYFAMEFIDGETLGDYAEKNRLPTRSRLEIIARVCDAVHHAHQRGLIHRDLKPGNILVDHDGQPKVLDFGVARLTDCDTQTTLETNVGHLVGTLAYMSPEQALADPLELDTRSDVYALGVILYELLSARLPYSIGRTLPEAVRTIREEDPMRLSSINRHYRGDIETIVAKALEKDKTRRYSSAAELASDIQRYLNDEPIVARPPSARYQLQKFARRHRALVGSTAAVLAVLLVGIVAATREAVRANGAEQALILQLKRVQQAEERLQGEVARAVAAERDSFWAQQKATNEMERAVKAEKQATLAKDAAEAASLAAQGSYQDAQKAYARVVNEYRMLYGPGHSMTQALMRELAAVYVIPVLPVSERKYDRAEALLEELWEIQRVNLGENAPGTLDTMQRLALLYGLDGKYQEAETLWRRTIDGVSDVWGEESAPALTSMWSLIGVYDALGKFQQAATLESHVTETANRLSEEKNPTGEQILKLVRQDGFTRSYGRPQSTSIESSSTRNVAQQTDSEKCSCVETVVLSEAHGDDFSRYLNQAMLPIQRGWNRLTHENRLTSGRVVVRVAVGQDGRVLDLRLVSSSGEDLERAATELVQSSSPLQRPPVDLKTRQLDLQIAFAVARSVSLSGRATVDGSGGVSAPSFSIAFAGNGRTQTQVQDGVFRVSLPAGQYRVAPVAIPSGYYLKTILAGSLDLLRNLLTVRDGQENEEIVVTLGVRPATGATQ